MLATWLFAPHLDFVNGLIDYPGMNQVSYALAIRIINYTLHITNVNFISNSPYQKQLVCTKYRLLFVIELSYY